MSNRVAEPVLAQAAHGYRTTVLSQAVRLGCKITGVVVLARLVSPSEHGLFAMAATFTFLLTLFRDFGMGAAAVQAHDLSDRQMSALCWLHVALGFALCAATLALAPVVGAFYREPRVTDLLLLMSVSFVLNGAGGWPRALLARELRFADVNRLETVGAVLGTLVMIAGGVLGWGAFAFVGFLLASEMVMFVAAWRLNPWRPRARADWPALRALARTGLHLTGYNLLLYGLQQTDTLLMGRWFGAAPTGFYNRAGQILVQPMNHLAAPFTQVLMATLARLGADSPFFARQFRDTSNMIAHFTLPLAVACMVLPAEIVRIVLGANWPDAAPLLLCLAISAAAGFLTATTYALCVASGHSARLPQLTAIALPVTLVFLWLGRTRGPVGLAAGLAAANVCLLLPRLWWASRGTPVRLRDFARAFAGPMVANAALGTGLVIGKHIAHDAGVGARLAAAALVGGAAVIGCTVGWPRLRGEFKYLRTHLPFLGNTNNAIHSTAEQT